MQPAWSRDGKRLLFQDFQPYTPSTATAVRVARGDGSGARTIFRGTMSQAFRSPPAWSPDGKKIAFGTTTPALEHRVQVVNADGSGRRRLECGLYPAWGPPAGRSRSSRNRRACDRSVAPGAAGRRRAELGGGCPTWSRDGKRLALLINANLSVVRADGPAASTRERSAVPRLSMIPSPPAWSRDGKRIYFAG